ATVAIPILRAVLMTRQAISPRFAISIRLNMFLVTASGGFLPRNLACGKGRHNCVYSKMRRRQRSFSVLASAAALREVAPAPLAGARGTGSTLNTRPIVNAPGLWKDRCREFCVNDGPNHHERKAPGSRGG